MDENNFVAPSGDGWIVYRNGQFVGTYASQQEAEQAFNASAAGGGGGGGVNQALESYLTGTAQQQAYQQAQSAADDAYRQALLSGQNESSARNAAIQAGSNALSSFVSLLNSYGSGAGLDPNALAAFIRGEGPLTLPGGPTLEREKFDLQRKLAEADLQANPRDIFKAAAYTGGAPFTPSASPASPAFGTGGGGALSQAAGAAGITGGAGALTGIGGGVPIEQARQELWAAGGNKDRQWLTAPDQAVANEYARITGRQVAGFAADTSPLAGVSPEERAALEYIFANRPDINQYFDVNPEVTGARGGERYLVTDPAERMRTWKIWNAPEVQAAGGLLNYAQQLGFTGQPPVEDVYWWGGTPPWIYDETIGGPNPNWQTPPPRTFDGGSVGGRPPVPPPPDGGYWAGGGGQFGIEPWHQIPNPGERIGAYSTQGVQQNASQYDPRLYNVPFYQQLRQQYGSSQQFPFQPQVPLPQANQIPLNFFSQQSPFNRGLLEAAYSTAGLSRDVYEEPFRQASEAFGGGSTPLRSSF